MEKSPENRGLRGLVPVRVRALLRVWIDRLAPRLCQGAFRLMSLKAAGRTLETLQRHGQLDYRDGRFRMTVTCFQQYKRLASCAEEPETVAWIEQFVRPGDVLYDIGANVGAYSLAACGATNGSVLVYAFEPSYATFAALCENIVLNRCGRAIVPLHVAVGAETGMVPFQLSTTTPGAAMHSGTRPDQSLAETAPMLRVPGYRLDDLVEKLGLQPPNHLKVDVDGTELDVLEGARRTLASPQLRSFLIEIDHTLIDPIVAIAEEAGLRVGSIHPRGDGTLYSNYIFVRPGPGDAPEPRAGETLAAIGAGRDQGS
jgi:FkbM family methyltransferase